MQWIGQYARGLRSPWHHADVTTLDEVAAELWRDDALRALGGEQAAVRWLRPVIEG